MRACHPLPLPAGDRWGLTYLPRLEIDVFESRRAPRSQLKRSHFADARAIREMLGILLKEQLGNKVEGIRSRSSFVIAHEDPDELRKSIQNFEQTLGRNTEASDGGSQGGSQRSSPSQRQNKEQGGSERSGFFGLSA